MNVRVQRLVKATRERQVLYGGDSVSYETAREICNQRNREDPLALYSMLIMNEKFSVH